MKVKIKYLSIILFIILAMSTSAVCYSRNGTDTFADTFYTRDTDAGYIESGGFDADDVAANDTETGKELSERARLALFDRQWDRALAALNQLMKKYPDSPYRAHVLFYTGKCYEEKKMAAEALHNYNAFVETSRNESLKEEAMRGIIQLNFSLYEETGSSKYLKQIEKRIKSGSRFVRYFAAFRLSDAKDKAYAKKAVPVLLDIIEEESDTELVERAKLRLMRIAPNLLKKSTHIKNPESKVLAIEVYDKKAKRNTVSINIPFMLASLALQSLPEDVADFLKEKGYSVDQVIKTISITGEIFKIEGDEIIFKIWIK